MKPRAPSFRFAGGRSGPLRAFTLLEILLSLALVSLLLVALNTFVFSMSELWGLRTEHRLFDQHVRAARHANRTVAAQHLGSADHDIACRSAY